ncbi:hypothetical protein KC363_g111 [Hortaea werneckii]|nr:hypothetical protein KC363_g111 [Hortaea werneckii]
MLPVLGSVNLPLTRSLTQLPDPRTPLVLHARLHKIDRVHHESAESTGDGAESEVIPAVDECQLASSTRAKSAMPRRPDEIHTRDLPIAGLIDSVPQDHFDQIHLPDHVLESPDVRVADLGPRSDVAQRWEIVKECLPHALALQPAQHLRKLRRRPVAVPIKGNRIAGLVARIDFFEGVEVHLTGRRVGEEAEGDFIFGVGFCEEIVEDTPVRESDAALVSAIYQQFQSQWYGAASASGCSTGSRFRSMAVSSLAAESSLLIACCSLAAASPPRRRAVLGRPMPK